ncbi:MAG: hypothetical protein HRT38_09550 [Alteromonadaceae bacterium]|nr:hypothetical protein [Alteromonadaceae bacterium]
MPKTNKQNSLIIKHVNAAQSAISQLISSGVTVLNVELAKQKPRIEIQPPRTTLLGEILMIRGTQAGVREEIKFSTLAGCIIFWKL